MYFMEVNGKNVLAIFRLYSLSSQKHFFVKPSLFWLLLINPRARSFQYGSSMSKPMRCHSIHRFTSPLFVYKLFFISCLWRLLCVHEVMATTLNGMMRIIKGKHYIPKCSYANKTLLFYKSIARLNSMDKQLRHSHKNLSILIPFEIELVRLFIRKI